MAETIISAKDLQKSFGDFKAVRGIDFEIESGTCVGLLGPNGAGKTTTMRMLMGLSGVSGGELSVLGKKPEDLNREEKSRIGLVPQMDNLDTDVSVTENLEIYGRFYGVEWEELNRRVPQLLKFMQLSDKAHARVNQLSGGMKRRLVIARALISNPEIVYLDEPTTGLDPQVRVLIWKQILSLKSQGKTLLLTTHYMDEAQRLCDRIIIIDEGKVLDDDTPKNLIKKHVSTHVVEVPKAELSTFKTYDAEREDIGDAVLLYVDKIEPYVAQIKNHPGVFYRPANLEDVFLRLTGRSLREGA